jgi:hypothetical protein
MKKAKFLFLGLMTLAFFTACEKNDRIKPMNQDGAVKVVKSQLFDMDEFPEDGCGLQTFDLIAGQHIYAGSVQSIMSLDGMTLFVKYEAFGDCEFTEAHLFVGNGDAVIPSGKTGNPKIGHFPYFWEEMGSAAEVVFSIPVADLDLAEDGCLKIAAHAVTICDGVEETAWARGSNLVFSLKVYIDGNEGPRAMTATGEPIAHSSDWRDVLTYYPLADALANPIDLVSLEDGTTVLGSAEVVEVNGNHELVITLISGEIYRTYIFIGPAEAFNLDVQNWPLINTWNSPVNPLHIPVSISDVLNGQEFDGSRWGWFVDYCVPLCLPPE